MSRPSNFTKAALAGLLVFSAACGDDGKSHGDADAEADTHDAPAEDTAAEETAEPTGETADPREDDADVPVDDVPPSCGDGTCAGAEDWRTCPQDCPVPADVATLLWFEDWELPEGGYARWTSQTYDSDWHDGYCHANGYADDTSVSPSHSHRSEITCTSDESHRGYGGLQFDGDAVVPAYTNTGQGIDAPYGVVNIFWSRLDVPYAFGGGKWFSFWTVNNSCDWTDDVITLGLENESNVLTLAHIENTGGTVDFDPGAPAFPVGAWARITIYINYHDGVMHVWQDGQSICHGTFSRPTPTMCQWHWGAYASGDNDNIVLHEDDNSLWKLAAPWTDFGVEPWFVVHP